jgi:DNA-binding GntR family transcriptional regulator
MNRVRRRKRPAAQPLSTRLAGQIIERARQLKLEEGAHLPEQDLAEAFRVSRTPVRMALLFLEKMDVVESRINRGFFLKKPGASLQRMPSAIVQGQDDPLYFRIAEDRLAGILETRVTEIELMRRYGVPRSRLLKLFARMTNEGWLERLPGHGWEFLPMLDSAAAYNHSYQFRMLIEPAALLEPGYAVNKLAFDQVRAEQQGMLDGGILRYSSIETFEIGAHFHETIVAGAGNAFMLDSLQRLNRVRRLFEYRLHTDRTRLVHECKDHLAMLDMIEAGEMTKASEFLRIHLGKAREVKMEIATRVNSIERTPVSFEDLIPPKS